MASLLGPKMEHVVPMPCKQHPLLGPEASRALLEVVGRVSLTEKRRTELAALAEKAQEAFNRPWPERKANPIDFG